MCLDVTGVDYLTYEADRGLPDGVVRRALRGRRHADVAQPSASGCACASRCPRPTPTVPSLFDVHPGTEAMEREVFDLFGIAFEGHPDLTRILMPEDWVGHPLRKDDAIGRIPVQFKAADRQGRPVTAVDHRSSGIETSEGAPGDDRSRLGRRRGAAPRARRHAAAVRGRGGQELVGEGPSEDQTMIINMGPQHPSTHGVLRLMLELEGETVLRTKPIVGYLHTGMEKTGEDLTYLQGPTNVTRMDYAAPLFSELVFSLTTEKLLGIDEDIPPRAQWIRMLLTEINRITQQPAVPRHQRHGHRRRVDDALRLARPRGGPPAPRDDHGPADEPQLHPPRRRGGRPARRLARRRC